MNPFEKDGFSENIEDLIKEMRKETNFAIKLQEMREASSMEIESRVLVKLWTDLGDHTETYWQALNAARDIVNGLKAARKAVRKNDPRMKAMLLRYISTMLAEDANTLEKAGILHQEMEHGAPSKPYNDGKES